VVDAKIEAVAVMDPPTPETEEPRVVPLDPVVAPVVVNGAARERHERRRERRAAEMERAIGDGAAGDESAADERGERAQGAERKAGRRQRRGDARPSAPRAKRSATEAPAADVDAAADGTVVDGELSPEQAPAGAPGQGKRSTRAAARAKKTQQSASAAMNSAEDNPALGALNRHLNMLMQQLTTSHRVIGRVAAERDALRQQLAELQGVPVDQIKITTVGAPSEEEEAPRRAHAHANNAEHRRDAPPAKSTRMQFFGGDDIVLVRKHRQYTVMVMLVVIAVGGLIFRHFGWSLPGNVSRDSLATLPYVGAIMQVFLMGWMMYRVVRVGGKGVRWLFPSEEKRRRR